MQKSKQISKRNILEIKKYFFVLSTVALVACQGGVKATSDTSSASADNTAAGGDANAGAGNGTGNGDGDNASAGTGGNVNGFDLKNQVDFYKQRYNLKDPYTKLVGNSGNGDDNLYGVRNFRVVLHGIYYRGGANNVFNKYGKLGNSNPLPDVGLKNLCEEGFSEADYLYPTNYAQAPHSVRCTNVQRQDVDFKYLQVTSLTSGNEKKILTQVWNHIKGKIPGPMYAHCWNGWHASGYAAAISLKQFCGWNADQADAYWVKNTDGVSVGYDSVRKKVRDFQPFPDLKITTDEKNMICPQ